jgi:hypothetical protein
MSAFRRDAADAERALLIHSGRYRFCKVKGVGTGTPARSARGLLRSASGRQSRNFKLRHDPLHRPRRRRSHVIVRRITASIESNATMIATIIKNATMDHVYQSTRQAGANFKLGRRAAGELVALAGSAALAGK